MRRKISNQRDNINNFRVEEKSQQFPFNLIVSNNKISQGGIKQDFKDNLKLVFLTYSVTQESSNDVWVLDSRCLSHMNGNIYLFVSLDTSI